MNTEMTAKIKSKNQLPYTDVNQRCLFNYTIAIHEVEICNTIAIREVEILKKQ